MCSKVALSSPTAYMERFLLNNSIAETVFMLMRLVRFNLLAANYWL